MAKTICYEKTIEDVQALLRKNDEWKERYAGYERDINENVEFISTIKTKFHEWAPLYVYLNFTNAKAAKSKVVFELRYLGQAVAKLTGYHKNRTLSTAGFDEKNARDFDCTENHVLRDEPWNEDKASAFRSYFKSRLATRNKTEQNKGNEEHRLESLLLTEFEKEKKAEKALPYIQPVKIADMQVRIPMPTPLSASNPNKIKYSSERGGGIDILARTGIGGQSTRLCIIELKKQCEPPNKVISQALAYTVFIRELLRSDRGETWWKLFGFTGKVPGKLVLFAACAMPDRENADTSFEGNEYSVGCDVIRLHYMYFREAGNKIESIRTSL